MTKEQKLKFKRLQRVAITTAAACIENRVQAAGCTDDCDSCKLTECAREGTAAIIGDMGDILFLK